MSSTPAVGPVFAMSSRRKRAALAATMVLVGMVGLAPALLFPKAHLDAYPVRIVGACAWALLACGLLRGGWSWRRLVRDVAASEEATARLNGFHVVMSKSNRLVLRRPNPVELFDEVCVICVDEGHVDYAVINMVDVADAGRQASAGLLTYGPTPATAQLLLDGARLQTWMMAAALQAADLVVFDDASTDARLGEFRPWCMATGHCSFAAIPLRRGDGLIGVLLLCSKARAFFGGQVSPLLTELGADLSFAIDNADRERERRSALIADRARLIAENANSAKTQFMAQMSHELRTPLNAMLGFAQLLATDKAHVLSGSQAERLRLITQAGWHLMALVDDVMDISRIESRRLQVVNVRGDVSSVVAEAIALIQPLARAQQVALAERRPSEFAIGAVADPRRLLQVLLNLLSNACKYNKPGGQVRVEVNREDLEVVIDVVDNGIGMSNEHLAHLFEPYNRLGNEGNAIEGSGIGLALTRQLVQMMNGRLEIASNLEAGTRARLVLQSCTVPLSSSAQASAEPSPFRDPQNHGVVLYIEDDPINRLLVEQMLLRCDGVHLLLAENGEDGIAMARIRRPDLVLLDMHLPDMSGFDVLEALRSDSRTEALRVVAVSANAVEADMAKALELGALDYWTKPLRLEEFVLGISTLLGTGIVADV